jgi:hypothetical protein
MKWPLQRSADRQGEQAVERASLAVHPAHGDELADGRALLLLPAADDLVEVLVLVVLTPRARDERRRERQVLVDTVLVPDPSVGGLG